MLKIAKMGKKTNLKSWLVITVFLLGVSSGPALSEVIYVDDDASLGGNGQSWPTAYKYLQDALYKPPSGGDQIWVAAGTYYPDEDEGANVDPNDRTETFGLIPDVAIYGGFAGNENPATFDLADRNFVTNETILSGDLQQNDGPDFANNDENSYHVVTGVDNATIDGFTVKAGNANGSDPDNLGGGMYNYQDSPTVVNCTFSGNSALYAGGMFNDTDSNPTVTNCTFNGNSASTRGGGMYNYSASPTVTNCTFSSNAAFISGGGGMANGGGGSPTVTNCTFSGNGAYYGGGMYNDSSSPTVTNCTFSGNSASNYGGGMGNIDSSSPTVTNCIFWGNIHGGPADESAQIYNSGSSTPVVSYSCVQDWSSGGTGNIAEDPMFVDADGPDNEYGTADDDLRLLAGSPCFDAADNTAVPADTADLDNDADTTERTPLDLDGEARFKDDPATADTGVADPPNYLLVVDMGAYEYGTIIYVDGGAGGANNGTSWTDAYNYLADTLADADARTEPVQIFVAEGTYRPDEDTANQGGTDLRTDTFALINDVAIYGGFPSGGSDWSQRDPNAYETILSGDIQTEGDNSDNSYHVVTGSSTDATAILDGFTIKAGNADGSLPYNKGGGMYSGGGSPKVTNCTFIDNSAYMSGGAMYNWGSSDPIITNCMFARNEAQHGGGIYNYNFGSSPILINCEFIGNLAHTDGGAMQNASESNPMVTNCTFSGNWADDEGGAIYSDDSGLMLVNCTFAGNSASNGKALACDSLLSSKPSNVELTNCILWDGGGDEIWNNDGSTITATYNCIQGWSSGGTGNISSNPVFKDADGPDNTYGTEDDNLELAYDSPCIDAGDSNSVPADTADLDGDGDTSERTPLDLAGRARFTDDPVVVDTGNGTEPIVEMGAYERYEFCGSEVYPHLVWDLSGPDGVRDCYTDFFDFVVMAAHWLEYTGPE